MPKPTLSYAFALALFLGSWTLSAKELATVMQMATKEKAQALLAQEDDFIRALSPFDVQSRLGDPEGRKEELRALIPQQARDFSPAEAKELLEACFRFDDLEGSFFKYLRVGFIPLQKRSRYHPCRRWSGNNQPS